MHAFDKQRGRCQPRINLLPHPRVSHPAFLARHGPQPTAGDIKSATWSLGHIPPNFRVCGVVGPNLKTTPR